MTYMVNSSSPVAMYYQLKEILKQKIQDGTWAPQTRIMSENEICKTYNVSRVTARRAIELLVNEGYLYTVKGKGTYVKDGYIEQPLTHFYSFREDLKKRGIETSTRMLAFEVVEADAELSLELGMPDGGEAFRIERVFLAGELPYAREISFIPRNLCPGLSEEQIEANGLYNSLKTHNVSPTRASEKLKAILVDRETASLLELNENEAAIYLTRTTYCNNTIMEKNISYVRGDMFVYSVELQSP